MQSRNRMFDDLARVTNSAASVMSGFREEAESAVRQRLERLLADMDLVPREEFEAVREMAANARRAQEELTLRVAALEAALRDEVKPNAPKPRRRKSTTATKSDESAEDTGDTAQGTSQDQM